MKQLLERLDRPTQCINNMDCIHGMRTLIAENTVDVCITSPPYNMGTFYNSYDDNRPLPEYLDWMYQCFKEIHRILPTVGSLFLNMGARPTNQCTPFQVLDMATRPGLFTLQNTVHWIKSIAIGDDTFGHYKPINSPRFINNCHEYIFHLTPMGSTPLNRKSIGVPYTDKSNIGRWENAGDGLHCRGNCWYLPYKTILDRSDRPHPATFPPQLPEMCLKLHGVENIRLVCDPFMGIGNTAIACKQLELSFMGFEIDAEYCKIAHELLKKGTTND